MGFSWKGHPGLSAESLNAFPYRAPPHPTDFMIDVHEKPSVVSLKVTTGLLLHRGARVHVWCFSSHPATDGRWEKPRVTALGSASS